MMSHLDPSLFQPEAIDPEVAAFNRKLERTFAELPAIHELPPEDSRRQRDEGTSWMGPIETVDRAEERVIPGPGDGVPVRVIVPDEVRGAYLHFHGGGWVLGAAHHMDKINWRLAQAAGLAVVSVDYRLAPEHPYPAAPDDCEAAALWMVDHAASEFGVERFLIGGESAGAHLAAVTLMRLRDRHDFTGFSGASLLFGIYDLCLTPSVRAWGSRPLVLTTKTMEWFRDHYAGKADLYDPDVSPIYGDLSGMPPALFTIGTLDPLVDDTLFMHCRWCSAGNRGELAIYPGGAHGFNLFPIAIAERANERIAAFLRELTTA